MRLQKESAKSLPEGWEIKKLGDLYEITSSKRVFQSEWEKSGVPFYRAREIVKLAQNGFVDNELFISSNMYNKYALKYGIPKAGDIMITGVGTLGICYVVRENDKFYFKDGNIIWLKKITNVDSRYVEYAFKSDFLRSQIDDSIGATVGTYTIIKAKNTIIPVPPLPEQKRIVSILDEAFAAIAKAKENTAKNLKNAKELFESYLQSVFANPGEDWEEKPLENIAQIINGYSFKSTDFSAKNTVKSIKITNVGVNEFVEEKDNLLPERFDKTFREYKINEGSIVLALTRTIISGGLKVAVVPKFYNGALLNQRVAAIIANTIFTTSDFLYLYFRSRNVYDYVTENVNSLMQPNLSIADLKMMPVLLPPIKEQSSIISKLNSLSYETKKLEAIYQHKINYFDELKKSILQKAFSGELNTTKEIEAV